MDRTSLILSVAIFALFLTYALFTEASYFHPLQLMGLDILGLACASAFFLAYAQRGRQLGQATAAPYIIAAIAIVFLIIGFQFVGIAVAVSLAGLYIMSKVPKRSNAWIRYGAIAAIIIITTALAFLPLSGLRGPNWRGDDEIAFNYYAAYTLVNGHNPYKANMQPILEEYGIPPTYLLNGSVAATYDYPALSFLPVLPLALAGLHGGFTSFIAIIVLLCIIAAFIVYRESGYNSLVLLPLGVWLIAVYILAGTIGQYIAIPILLLLAYIKRRRLVLSGILLGLSASITQLAWFCAPFLLILVLRERGLKSAAKSALASATAFAAVNGYFIIVAPGHFFRNIFSIFSFSKLLLYGPNIGQVLVRSYPVTLWYTSVVSAMSLISLLVLFYLYTDTLKPLVVIAPSFIFFLTWRNLSLYALPFVPFIIAMCYMKEKGTAKDLPRSKRCMAAVLLSLIFVSLLLAVYAHYTYTKDDTIQINSIKPMAYSSNGAYIINGILINITNNGAPVENVSFLYIDSYTSNVVVFSSLQLGGIAPMSSRDYQLFLNPYATPGNASIYVIAYSSDYMRGEQVSVYK